MASSAALPLPKPASEKPASYSVVESLLLDDWQRNFPLVSRPFTVVGDALGVSEDFVLSRLRRFVEEGVVARVGGVVRPNTLGVSTLAALAAPDLHIDAIADVLTGFPGINHVYLRENTLNLWFVVTGPDDRHVSQCLEQITARTGHKVLQLRLERAFHIDLGFGLSRQSNHIRHPSAEYRPVSAGWVDDLDRQLAQQLCDGLPLMSRPFQMVANGLDIEEADVISRLERLVSSGIIPRIGVIVRHRALGWRSNAMVVWDVPEASIERSGEALAAVPGVNLCYRRTRYAREWPYNLYCMVHARSREQALRTVASASGIAGLDHLPRSILFSQRCFKQTGALISKRRASNG